MLHTLCFIPCSHLPLCFPAACPCCHSVVIPWPFPSDHSEALPPLIDIQSLARQSQPHHRRPQRSQIGFSCKQWARGQPGLNRRWMEAINKIHKSSGKQSHYFAHSSQQVMPRNNPTNDPHPLLSFSYSILFLLLKVILVIMGMLCYHGNCHMTIVTCWILFSVESRSQFSALSQKPSWYCWHFMKF